MSIGRGYKRKKSTQKEIEVYNRIQNRYTNMFNNYSMQPLEVLDRLKLNKMSSTDKAAFDEAYKLVSSTKAIVAASPEPIIT